MCMSLVKTRYEQLFPVLTAAQIDVARRFASSAPKSFGPNEVLYAVGEWQAPVFIVTSGDVLIRRRHATGKEELVAMLPVGGITGEISQLAGRSTLAEARAGPNGCEVLPFDGAHLRALIIGSAELGEIVMRAFILRRTALINGGPVRSLPGARAIPCWRGWRSSSHATAIRVRYWMWLAMAKAMPWSSASACAMRTCPSGCARMARCSGGPRKAKWRAV
jgi:thioredoxin reductase (NADPH)